MGHLSGLLQKIQPAVELVKEREEALQGSEFVQQVAEQNVDLVTQEILDRSPVLAELIQAGDVGLVAALYSVESGAVRFHKLRCGEA